MNQITNQKLKSIIYSLGERKSVLTETEILAIGANQVQIEKLVDSGVLYPSAKGIYMPENADFQTWHSFVEVAVSFSKGVVCLASALRFHGITTQLPGQVWIALPEGSSYPQDSSLPVKVVYMPESIYEQGIETHIIEGIPVKIYNIPKTIVDCFDFASEIGLDVALEAVEETWRTARCEMDEIMEYAKNRNFDLATKTDFDEAVTNPESIYIFI